jgi:hypothetical protein
MKPVKWSQLAVKRFNDQLRDLFGVDTTSGQQMWRISWSDDQFEMRESEYTDVGLLLPYPIVRELPKYPYIKARYVLEHLVAIPDMQSHELPTQKTSYEPLWTFEDSKKEYLPPHLEACKYIINLVTDAMSLARDGRSTSKSFRKFLDEDENQEKSIENKAKRVKDYTEYLFGDQSSLGGTTVTGETIIVPRNYEVGNGGN